MPGGAITTIQPIKLSRSKYVFLKKQSTLKKFRSESEFREVTDVSPVHQHISVMTQVSPVRQYISVRTQVDSGNAVKGAPE